MEFLRKIILQSQTHLKGLTLSQRLAIGSCAALIAVSLLWLVNWASSPDMVKLLDQPMEPDEVSRIQEVLDAGGIEYKLEGAVIKVPAAQRSRLLAQLGQKQLLPDDISLGFEKLLEENSSPWLNMREQDRRWSLALGNELARVLREFDGVQDARVFIDRNMKRGIGQNNVMPTASVYVKLQQGQELSKSRTHALASFVSRAVAGLDIHNVAVTDATTGRSGNVPRAEDDLAFDDLEDRRKKEAYFAQQIKDLFSYIPGLQVRVHAELVAEHRQERETIYGKPPIAEERIESTSETRGAVAGGPGVVPNTTAAVNTPSPGESLETKSSETRYDARIDEKIVTTETPRHDIRSLTASINVPKSYLVGALNLAGGEQQPTDDQIDEQSKKLLEKIEKQVMGALHTSQENVFVDWFPDDVVLAMDSVAQSGMGGGMMGYVDAYWDKAGLAALALISLVMMMMVVRKVGEGPVLPGEDSPESLRRKRQASEAAELADSLEAAVGEAREGEPLLFGREVDEATLRTQQIVEQVSELVRDDTAASVAILQRWIDQGKQ